MAPKSAPRASVPMTAMVTSRNQLPSLSFAAGPGCVPIDLDWLVATRLLIQASSGGGKSWTLRWLLEQLHGAWLTRLSVPQGRLLRVLIDRYPEAMDRTELAAAAGNSATSSGFANNLGALRSLGLIDYPQRGQVMATDLLFLQLPGPADSLPGPVPRRTG